MTLLSLPAWMDILVNVIGYAGFVGIATFWSSDEKNEPRNDQTEKPRHC
jgi:hypothetical protein